MYSERVGDGASLLRRHGTGDAVSGGTHTNKEAGHHHAQGGQAAAPSALQ